MKKKITLHRTHLPLYQKGQKYEMEQKFGIMRK